ncbi:MAG: tetratricopeptide repeat protein [Cyanobacteria bacterium P01_A01_bin.84]
MSQESYNQGLEKLKKKDEQGGIAPEVLHEAIALFNTAIQENPYFSQAYFYRGLAHYDLGEFLQAVSDYTQALKLDSQSAETYYSRALARLALKNLPGTLDDVENVIRINIKYAAAYDLRGIVRRKQGFIHEAIANFKNAAQLYLEQKNKEGCRLCLEKIKQLQPKTQPSATAQQSNSQSQNYSNNNSKNHQNQPSVTENKFVTENKYFIQLLEKAEYGDVKEATEDLNWLLQTDPQDGQAYCYRGVVRCKQGKYQEAISDFNQALKLKFQDPAVYRNRGKARSYMGDNQGAIADFNQAIQMKSDDSLVYVARGNAYREMGNYIGAIEDYTQSLKYNQQNAHAYYNRGIAYTHMEEMQRAMDDYQKAASMFCEQEDWDSYQIVLDNLKKFKSPSPEIQKTQDELLRQRLLRLVGGHWEIAQRLIEQAKHYYPGMSEEWYLETVIYDLERDKDR